MFGKYFTYNGRSSEEFGLMIGSIGGNNAIQVPLGLDRDPMYGTLNRYKNRVNSMGTNWQEPLTFEIGGIFDICSNTNITQQVMTEDEVNEIAAWLTSPDYPLLFHMYDYDFTKEVGSDMLYVTGTSSVNLIVTYVSEDGVSQDTTIVVNLNAGTATCVGHTLGLIKKDGYFIITATGEEEVKWLNSITKINDYSEFPGDTWGAGVASGTVVNSFQFGGKYEKFLNKQYDYFGVFTAVIPQLIGERIVGLTLTFSTTSPFAWTKEKSQSISGAQTVTIHSDSAERNREIYPIITINEPSTTTLGQQTVTITNITDNSKSLQIVTRVNDQIIIDCERAFIKDSSGALVGFDDLGIRDVGSIYWPRLYYGDNRIRIQTSSGNATVNFTWREPRKVGAY